MKKLLYILIMCSTLIACDKMPANGDLDGMWQVVEIEHNGVKKDVTYDQIYMSIQLKLFMLGDTENPRRYYGYFEHEGNMMRLWQFSFPSTNETAADDNIPLTEEQKGRIEKWGFYSLDEKFTVVSLSKDVLVLKNDAATIKYIKF